MMIITVNYGQQVVVTMTTRSMTLAAVARAQLRQFGTLLAMIPLCVSGLQVSSCG